MFTLNTLIANLSEKAITTTWRQPIGQVVIDSREATPDALFVAIRSGHNHVWDAFAAGAGVALISEPVDFDGLILDIDQVQAGQIPDDITLPLCIRVKDTVLALQQLARNWRRNFSPTMIGITGSVGKSSTKELVYSVLAQKFCTLKSRASYNNEIGLPYTLLQLNANHDQVVLEMGTYAQGEIEMLCQLAAPQVGIVTKIGPTHLERFGTLEKIAQAKQELVESLDASGMAILNHDDPYVALMANHIQAHVFTYGLSDQADLWADQITSQGLAGLQFMMHYQGEHKQIQTPLVGRHNVYTALAATAVGLTQGMQWTEIQAGLQNPSTQPRLVPVSGPQNSLILDDTYNSSADSSLAALSLLRELDNPRKIAVLGDMAELGTFEEEGHRQVGRYVARVVDLLVTVGAKSRLIAQEAVACGFNKQASTMLDTTQSALEYLQEVARPGDAILIKGSRSLAMETIVDQLKRDAPPPTQDQSA